jgi:1-acyl-sn-glycerol-3-phosphate acyltransferase
MEISIEKIEKKELIVSKPGWWYRLFTSYIGCYQNDLYYRKTYWVNTQNIPQNSSLMVVANHQNCMNDALAVVVALKNSRKEKKVRAVTRADAFNNPTAGKFLRWLGLLPAFRMDREGVDSLSSNNDTFTETENELLDDGTIVIFPEGLHQDKRWLGKFTYGYLRMAFQAAEKANFEKEILVLPSCNHYSDYSAVQEDVVVKFGTPVSLVPFYEMYKTKPRTAQRQVNELIWQQVSGLMLNITDLENYESINFIRETYGVKYAEDNGFNPNKLPQKLSADKQLFAELEKAKTENSDLVQSIYYDTAVLNEEITRLKIKDANFEKRDSLLKIFAEGLCLALFLPIYLFSIISNIFFIYPPKIILSKVEDKMFFAQIRLIFNALVSVPLTIIFGYIAMWYLTKSVIISVVFLASIPFLFIFAHNYEKSCKYWFSQIRFHKLLKKGKLNDLILLRTYIHQQLDKILKRQ